MFTQILFSTINRISDYIPLAINLASKIFAIICVISFSSLAQSSAGSNPAKGIDGISRPRVAAVSEKTEKDSPKEMERLAFKLLNQSRIENGLQPISWSEDMAKVARLHSNNMAAYKFFSHTGLDGLQVDGRADKLGFTKWQGIGENIAYNKGFPNPVEFAAERFMISKSHRNNLLDKRWKEGAVGVAISQDGTYYFTQVFLQR